MRFNFFSKFFAGSSVSQGFCKWHLPFFWGVSDDLRDAMASPCGHYESARHSGLSHPDQRGSPGQENRLLEHETRRLTEELHTRTDVEPGVEKFPSCSSICISTQTTNMH